MIKIPAAVKGGLFISLGNGRFRERISQGLGGLNIAAGFNICLDLFGQRRHAHEDLAADVIDQRGRKILQAPVNAQPRTLRGPGKVSANPLVTVNPFCFTNIFFSHKKVTL